MLLSACLITLNEAARLDEVLARLRGVDEIVVVDSGSTDGTQDIARRHGAQVIHHDWPGFAKQKAHATSLCQGQWVLCIDGDEVLGEGAIAQLRALIAHTPCNGFELARHDVFMQRAMTRSRPEYLMRLFRKDRAVWDVQRLVHEHVEVQAPTGRAAGVHMLHYGYDNITGATAKFNRYSSLKAQQNAAAGKRGSVGKMLLSPLAYWLRFMLLRGFWREGLAGMVFAGLQAQYAFASEAKLLELRRAS